MLKKIRLQNQTLRRRLIYSIYRQTVLYLMSIYETTESDIYIRIISLSRDLQYEFMHPLANIEKGRGRHRRGCHRRFLNNRSWIIYSFISVSNEFDIRVLMSCSELPYLIMHCVIECVLMILYHKQTTVCALVQHSNTYHKIRYTKKEWNV